MNLLNNLSKRLLFVGLLSVLGAQESLAQTTKCDPFLIPLVTYQYQKDLRSGIGAELNVWFPPKGCDCNGPFGGLCYLWGPTAAVRTSYFPDARAFDLSANFGYRMVFIKPEVSAGYTFVGKNYGESFFHIDPAIGLDIAGANLAVGYSFRTIKINDRIGGLFVRVGVSPLLFFPSSGPRKVLSDHSKATKAQRKQLRASF
jgi:hypothetical protein